MASMRLAQNWHLNGAKPSWRTVLVAALALIGVFALSAANQLRAQSATNPPTAAPPTPAPASQSATPAPIDFSKVEIKTTNLGHNFYMLEGRGSNVTVAVGRDSILMIDSEYAPLHDKILAAIRAISDKPIRYLVDTHFHTDHTGGNAAFAKDGAVIVAQENVKKRLASGTTNGLTGVKTPPVAPDFLPVKTFKQATTIRFGGIVAQLNHIANAHTDGDSYIWFKRANVLTTGDTFFNGRYPNIDVANGGNIKGMIDSANLYLGFVNDDTKIVPGHGPVATKADLLTYRNVLVMARDRMAALIKAGKTEAEVVAARPYADYDAKLATDDQAAISFIRLVYRSLAGGKTS